MLLNIITENEKEFDKLLNDFAYYSDDNSGTDPIKATLLEEKLESFNRQFALKLLKGMRDGLPEKQPDYMYGDDWASGNDFCLSQIQATLDKTIKEIEK